MMAMPAPEKFGYYDMLLTYLLEQVELEVFYLDTGCSYDAHWKLHMAPEHEPPNNVKTPWWHGRGHGPGCFVLNSAFFLPGEPRTLRASAASLPLQFTTTTTCAPALVFAKWCCAAAVLLLMLLLLFIFKQALVGGSARIVSTCGRCCVLYSSWQGTWARGGTWLHWRQHCSSSATTSCRPSYRQWWTWMQPAARS
jgi:hypothetical protein